MGRLLSALANPDHRIQEEETGFAFGETFQRCASSALAGYPLVRNLGTSRIGHHLRHRLPVREVFPSGGSLSAWSLANRCHQSGSNRIQHGSLDYTVLDQSVLGTLCKSNLPGLWNPMIKELTIA